MTILTRFYRWFTCETVSKMRTYPYTCQICGYVAHVTTLANPNPAMGSLVLMQIYKGPPEMTQIKYGNLNKRSIWSCRKHKESEIKKKIKALI